MVNRAIKPRNFMAYAALTDIAKLPFIELMKTVDDLYIRSTDNYKNNDY